MNVAMGTANYDARGNKEFNHFSLEDGTKYFRVLPPLHSLAKEGQWFVYRPGHWVGGSPKPGKDKAQKRQFFCTLKKDKNKMVTQRCPMCEVVDGLKGLLAELTDAKGKALPGNEAKTQGLNFQIRNLQRGSYYYVNAIDISTGKMGDLKLPYSAFTLLEEEIGRIRARKLSDGSTIDPLGKEDGLVFAFTRGKGDNGRYTFAVKVHQVSKHIEGVGDVNIDVKSPLTDDIVSRLGKETHDLSSLIREISEAQIDDIVKRGIPAIDEIFEINKPKSTSSNAETTQAAADETAQAEAVTTTQQSASQATAQEATAQEATKETQTTTPAAGILANTPTAEVQSVQTNTENVQKDTGNAEGVKTSYSNLNDDQFRQFLKG